VGAPFKFRPNGLVLHWTRRTWVTSATPKTSTGVALNGVTAVSSGNVWAVGQSVTGSGLYRAYALHWNGRRWASVSLSRRQGTGDWQLNSVVPTKDRQLVAVGSDTLAGAPRSALYALWTGRSWSISDGPRDAAELNVVAFDGRHTTWAVGSISTSQQRFKPLVQVNG
jgi:hypothetical protein